MEFTQLVSKINEKIQDHLHLQQFNPELRAQIIIFCKELEGSIASLNSFISTYSFQSINEEIHFFKNTKPNILKHYMFLNFLVELYSKYHYLELYHYKIYKKETHLALLKLNNERNFYNYFKKQSTHNDTLYFTRSLDHRTDGFNYNINGDGKTTCSHGFLLAKLLAIEMYHLFCLKQVQVLKSVPLQNNSSTAVKWKANKVDAIELIYALYYAGAIQSTTGTLQEVALQFEQLFNIEISQQLYRDYIDIKRRKIEPAKFLMKLVTNFKTKIEEDYD